MALNSINKAAHDSGRAKKAYNLAYSALEAAFTTNEKKYREFTSSSDEFFSTLADVTSAEDSLGKASAANDDSSGHKNDDLLPTATSCGDALPLGKTSLSGDNTLDKNNKRTSLVFFKPENPQVLPKDIGLSHRFANSFKFKQLRLSSCCSSQGRISLNYRQIY